MLNITITGDVTPSRSQAGVDWQAVATAVGPRVKAAWTRAEYVMLRADKGQGPVARGVTIPGFGTPWATICHHGTGHRAASGAGAEDAGRNRAQWCQDCAADAPATLPLIGAQPETVTTATQAGPAQPEPETAPEPDKAPAAVEAGKGKAPATRK